MTTWFVEELAATGRFHPAAYHGDRPQEKRTGGPRRTFRGEPVKVAPEHVDLPLDALAEIYGGCDA